MKQTRKTPPIPAALAAVILLSLALSASAEKADKDKPTNIESNKMSSDDARRMTIFEGNVVLTKGTVVVRADRIVVRQDADGFQFSTAYGKPVRFRQKGDPKGGCDGLWTDGEALRIEIDERAATVKLFESARVNRGGDQVTGAYIFVDQRSDFFQVTTGKGEKEGQTPGRVTAKLAPTKPREDAKK